MHNLSQIQPASCVQSNHQKIKGDGPGSDIVATQKSIAIAESLYRHKWDFGTAKSKALKKYQKVTKETHYDFNIKLDQDVF